MSLDRSRWPRCVLWHGWLPGLSRGDERSSWAASFVSWLVLSWNVAWVPIRWITLVFWTPPDYWDADDLALEMPDAPNIWTDGSRVDYSSVGDFEVAGAGVYLPAAEVAFESAAWGVAEECGDARLERCRAFMPIPGVL